MANGVNGVDRLLARRALAMFRSTLAWLEQDISAIPALDSAVETTVTEMQVQARHLRQLAAQVQDALDAPPAAPVPAAPVEPIQEKGEDDDA